MVDPLGSLVQLGTPRKIFMWGSWQISLDTTLALLVNIKYRFQIGKSWYLIMCMSWHKGYMHYDWVITAQAQFKLYINNNIWQCAHAFLTMTLCKYALTYFETWLMFANVGFNYERLNIFDMLSNITSFLLFNRLWVTFFILLYFSPCRCLYVKIVNTLA